MPNVKKTYALTLSLIILLTGLLLPAFCHATYNGHKITVDTDPHYIRANQPFNLLLKLTVKQHSGKAHLSDLKTDDFKLLKGDPPGRSVKFLKESNEKKYTYTFTLVPKHAGDLVIMPFTLEFDSNGVYTSDTFIIHVYNERISPEDSIEKLKTAKNANQLITPPVSADSIMRAAFSQFFNKTGATSMSGTTTITTNDTSYSWQYNDSLGAAVKKNMANTNRDMNTFFTNFHHNDEQNSQLPDGIYLKREDSVYATNARDTFKITYQLRFVNTNGWDETEVRALCKANFHAPAKFQQISVTTNKSTSSSTNITNGVTTSSFESDYFIIVKLVAPKRGTYTLPSFSITRSGKTYTALPVKVIVK